MTDTPNSPPCDHPPAIDASAAVQAIMDVLHQIEDQGYSCRGDGGVRRHVLRFGRPRP